MGSFMGHFVNGIFFIILACLEGLSGFSNEEKTRKKFMVKRALVQLVALTLGMAGELFTALNESWTIVNWGNVHHIIIQGFFVLSAAVDLKLGKPDRRFLVLALLVELFLFAYHEEGRMSLLEMRCHVYVTIATISSVLSVAYLLHNENRETLSIAIASFIFQGMLLSRAFIHVHSLNNQAASFSGLWFIQIAFVLFNLPPLGVEAWPHSKTNLLIITSIFPCYILPAILATVTLYKCVAKFNNEPNYNPVKTEIQLE